MTRVIHGKRGLTSEWSFTSGRSVEDPFNAITLDVVLKDEDNREWIVPCYWAGGDEWRVRFAPPHEGDYAFRTICDSGDSDLGGREGLLRASDYDGDNELIEHGPIIVSPDRRHFQHADGIPFFWLADTWWMGLCRRLRWPEDFQLLTQDRKAKGFTVIQIVAGLYPDMPAFDERGSNEAGFPWEREYSRVNPSYFDMADLRVHWLVSNGLAPCVVGCWGYFLRWMGIERMKRHWRYLVARWGSYPVFWCLAGEATMPYYLSDDKEEDRAFQKSGWTEVARYVRELDPYRRPITIHPTNIGRDQVLDPGVLDFDMLQTGHGDRESLPKHVESIRESLSRSPKMPVLVGEVCYEGILEASRPEMQRILFWSAMLSGTAGHTYGANGIWQLNTRERAFGPSPHGGNWGITPWEDAYQLPGSSHLGIAKSILDDYRWWEFEPHSEWVDPHWDESNFFQPYSAGIPSQIRVTYIPKHGRVKMLSLDSEARYDAIYVNPKTGERHPIGTVEPDENGEWQAPSPPIYQDWVLVLERLDQ